MAVELATAYVSIIPSMQGIQGSLAAGLAGPAASAAGTAGDAAGTKFTAGFGSKVKSLAGAAGLAVGVAGVVSLIQGTIGAASDLGETVNRNNVLFGDNAAAMDTWAKGAATSAGLSRQAALDIAGGFGNMFTQLGFAGDEVVGMSQGVVQLAADLGSFNNLPTGEVADMLAAAFRGEYDALQRLIPNINAARVETEALAMTGKTSAKELTAQEKAAATLAIVQRDGAMAAGDFARTSDGLANSSKILGAQMRDIQAAIGVALVPAMAAAVSTGSALIAFFQSGSTASQGVLVALGLLTAALIANQVAHLAGAASAGVHAVAAGAVTVAHGAQTAAVIASRIAHLAGVGALALVTAAQWAWNAAMTANPIGLVILAIAGLVAAFVFAWQNSETFRAIVTGAWNGIKDAAQAVGAWFTTTIPAWWAQITASTRAAWTAIAGFFAGVWANIQGTASAVGAWFTSTIPAWWNSVAASTRGVWSGIVGFFGGVWSNIVGGVQNVLNGIRTAFSYTPLGVVIANFGAIVDFFRGIPGRIVGALGDLGGLLFSAGARIIGGLADGIRSAIGRATSAVSGVVSAVRDFLPFSPAKRGPFAGRGWSFYSGQSVASDFARGLAADGGKVAAASAAMMGQVAFGPEYGGAVPVPVPAGRARRDVGGGGDTINVHGHYWTAQEVAEAIRNAKRDKAATHGLAGIATGVGV